MNKIKEKYVKLTEKYHERIKNNKYYKKYKNCFKITHMKGYHIEFYNMPYEFNKKSARTNYNKFNKRIVNHMNIMLKNAKNDIYLPHPIIDNIKEQINTMILPTNDL